MRWRSGFPRAPSEERVREANCSQNEKRPARNNNKRKINAAENADAGTKAKCESMDNSQALQRISKAEAGRCNAGKQAEKLGQDEGEPDSSDKNQGDAKRHFRVT